MSTACARGWSRPGSKLRARRHRMEPASSLRANVWTAPRKQGQFSSGFDGGTHAVMCSACWCGNSAPLALMNSADRLPISETRCNAASALRVLPLPGRASGSSSPPEHGLASGGRRPPELLDFSPQPAWAASRGRYASPRASMAQMILAVLAAMATAATSGGLRLISAATHGLAFSGWALAWRKTAI